MRIVSLLFIVGCVLLAVRGTPQTFYRPFAGKFNFSAKSYYAPQHQFGQDYNLNHGEVDAPNENGDDDSANGSVENFSYSNGFFGIPNNERIDASQKPHDVNSSNNDEEIPEDFLSFHDDEEDNEDNGAQGEQGIKNQPNLATYSNDRYPSAQSIIKGSPPAENTENSVELESNENNWSSAEVTDEVISEFVHPLHRPSSEWPLEDTETLNLKRKPQTVLNCSQRNGLPVRKTKPQQVKRIRVVQRIRDPRAKNIKSSNLNSNTKAANTCGTCQCGLPTTRRMAGGQFAAVNEFPWLALITYNDTIHCGGTLINDRFVLTAAHCVRGFVLKLFQLTFSEHNTDSAMDTVLVRRRITRIFSPGCYNSKSFDNDIAILELSSPINFETSSVRPICLPTVEMDNTGKIGIIAGWSANKEGKNSSSILQKAKVPIISNQQCRLVGMKITDDMVCAGRLFQGGIDACQGDSGGPLMVVKNKRFYLGGIISWGDGCAKPNKPGVYTRTTSYLPWIDKRTSESCGCT